MSHLSRFFSKTTVTEENATTTTGNSCSLGLMLSMSRMRIQVALALNARHFTKARHCNAALENSVIFMHNTCGSQFCGAAAVSSESLLTLRSRARCPQCNTKNGRNLAQQHAGKAYSRDKTGFELSMSADYAKSATVPQNQTREIDHPAKQ